MHTDLPLKNNEHDKLGRFLFATEIASGLINSFRNNNESIVLGINGTWGTGKSTLINFIIQEVERITKEKNEEIIILKFNPWMFSGQKELQSIFLKELLLKLQHNKEILKEAANKISDFMNYFEWVKYIHTGAGEALKDSKKFLEVVGGKKDLQQLKDDVDKLLIDSGVKLYITIDDIDRLSPSEITDIFQLVKLNGNFANTIFILAYDREIVTSALQKQFGENGNKYIEKIVQIDYTLPTVSSQNIKRIFKDSAEKLFEDKELSKAIEEELSKEKPISFIDYFQSIRDIYRFNNSIKLRLPSIYKELNLGDFLIVESFRIFTPNVYQFIIKNKENFIYKKENNSLNTYSIVKKSNKEHSIKDFIDKSSFDLVTKNLLSQLFLISGNEMFHSYKNENLIREKRVANRDYFDRYFNLQLSDFDIQESTFLSFIKDSSLDKKLTILKEIQTDDNLFQFLNWTENKSKNATQIEIEKMINSCLEFMKSLEFKRQPFFSYHSDYMFLENFCSRMLGKINPKENRWKLIIKYLKVEKEECEFSNFYISDGIMNAKEKFDNGKLYYSHEWFHLFTEEKEIEKIFLKEAKKYQKAILECLFKKEVKSKNKLNLHEIQPILISLEKQNINLYDKEFHNLIANDKDLIKYVWISLNRSSMSSSEKSGINYQLEEHQLFRGMNKEEIKNRFDKFDENKFESNEIKVINLYLKAYNDGFKEKRYYNFNTLEVIQK